MKLNFALALYSGALFWCNKLRLSKMAKTNPSACEELFTKRALGSK